MGNSICRRSNIDQLIQQQQPSTSSSWTCLVILNVFIKEILLDIFHNRQNDTSYKGFPDDPKTVIDILLNQEEDQLKDKLGQENFEYIIDSLRTQSGTDTRGYSSKWDIMVVIELFLNSEKSNDHLDQLFREIKDDLTSNSYSIDMEKIKNIIGTLNSYNYKINPIIDGIKMEDLEKKYLTSIEFKDNEISCCKTSVIQYLKLCQQPKDNDENLKNIYGKLIEVIKVYDQGKNYY